MFLEVWMIAILFAIFALGMISLYRSGWKDGSVASAEATLTILESQGLIGLVDDGNEVVITKALPTPEEFDRMMEKLKEI